MCFPGVIFSTSDLPDGPLGGPRVQPRFQKYLSFHLSQITGLSRAIPFPIEGRFAIVTSVGFGMRWTAASSRGSAARTSDEAADGEVVWS
jgi:hypothetical protein